MARAAGPRREAAARQLPAVEATGLGRAPGEAADAAAVEATAAAWVVGRPAVAPPGGAADTGPRAAPEEDTMAAARRAAAAVAASARGPRRVLMQTRCPQHFSKGRLQRAVQRFQQLRTRNDCPDKIAGRRS